MLHKDNCQVNFRSYLGRGQKWEDPHREATHACLAQDVHTLSIGELMDVVKILREELHLLQCEPPNDTRKLEMVRKIVNG